MRTFEYDSANVAYAKAWHDIMGHGSQVPSRNGNTMEVNPGVFRIARPTQPLITCIGRPVNVAFALAEVLWILAGRRDAEMVKFYNRRITEWSDDGEYFNAPYGYRLREAHGFDQIEDVVRTLQSDLDSRQAILNVWHPESDRGWVLGPENETEDDRPQSFRWQPKVTKDRACNVLCHLMIREGKLNWLQVVRSNDLIWGVPYNFMQWMHVQQYIAARLGIPPGYYTHISDSLHVYDFNRPDRVELFDLYQMIGHQHAMLHQGDVDSDVMREVLRMEEYIRTSERAMRPGGLFNKAEEVGQYWQTVLLLLLAHRHYTDKDNDACLLSLTAEWGDPVYSLTQLKFYWQNRWRGSTYALKAQHAIEDYLTRISHSAKDNMVRILHWFDDSIEATK